MEVKLLNPHRVNELYEDWGAFARVCYNSPEGKEALIGKGCHSTGHYSGSRTTYFIFHISGVSRALTAQLNRHSIGSVVNEKSMRYVDFSDAEVVVPPSIKSNIKALEAFNKAVEQSRESYKNIIDALAEDGLHGEPARQDARYVCNIGVATEGMWAFDLEAMEHLAHHRLCERAQWEIRNLVSKMVSLIREENSQVARNMYAHCIHLGYCPENNRQCKKFKNTIITKQEFKDLMKSEEYRNLIRKIKSK